MTNTNETPKTNSHASLSGVISRTFDLSINVTQLETGEIEVKDTAGIRIHLLNKDKDKGLWMYFNTRLDQYGR